MHLQRALVLVAGTLALVLGAACGDQTSAKPDSSAAPAKSAAAKSTAAATATATAAAKKDDSGW